MSLSDCLDNHTHRQYLTWMEWLKDYYNQQSGKPSTLAPKPIQSDYDEDGNLLDGPPTLTKEQVVKYQSDMARAYQMKRLGLLPPPPNTLPK